MRMRHGPSWKLLLERLGSPGQRQHCKSASRHRGDGPHFREETSSELAGFTGLCCRAGESSCSLH